MEIILGLINQNEGDRLFNNKIVYGNLSNYLNLGYVSEENTIIEGTLFENLTSIPSKNNINCDSTFLESILKICVLDKIFSKNKLSSHILDEGKNLSFGQVQRLKIARSLTNRPDILFLDEATNGMDKDLEKKIINGILKIGITVVLITHHNDLDFLSDKIINLDKLN